jgi:Protein of unknown function (DUF1326)
VSDLLPWHLSGTYLESCNCEAICPCRRVGGRQGGRSSYGICLGTLSWAIERGRAGGVDLSNLNVVLAQQYDDDEPGSPWSFFLYLDERGDDRQLAALTEIFLGNLGGTPGKQFPWAFKGSDLIDVRTVAIEIDHTPGRGWFRAGDEVTVRIRGPVAGQEPTTCIIPGHHQQGRELYAETLAVDAAPLEFALTDSCAYESGFAYSSDG